MKRLIITIILLLLLNSTSVSANDKMLHEEQDNEDTSTEDYLTYYEDFDYDDIQSAIDNVLVSKGSFDFKDYVGKLISSGEGISAKGAIGDLFTAFTKEFDANRSALFKLIMIAIVAAVFTNFTNVFNNNQVGETSFYITYLLLFTTITGTFATATAVASGAISAVLSFMKALIPTYFMSIAFCSTKATTLVFYESALVLITIVDVVLVRVMIPLVNIYMVITLVNNLAKEDFLSKLAELLESIIKWSMRTLFIAVVGFNTIQGLIVPASNSLKKSLAIKFTKAIPGIGNSLNSVAETVMGAGTLIKNAIGVTGLVVIVLICVIPLIKLIITMLIYKVGVAIVQPISDKRVITCISGAANAAGLLVYVVSIAAVLFMVTIAILAATTSIGV
ncbi:stage III sporulation protein AE [Anaerosporobacter mobilis DSM 15930]|uniref:Stage III sporulation protein AE n=1 Tax=Anaerosporobacter mobilis DSM 15930 TaxID=1120996 RepID=A0A1M7M2J2_9FIRM|nr:stage III sporulation protein AE [Anaerosporobacter mobilis]SHM84876.1 stage III sporulation protein AE [Anaerosporobacter mobilis DSM 15930]